MNQLVRVGLIVVAMLTAIPVATASARVPPPEREQVRETSYRIGIPYTVTVGETVVRVKAFDRTTTYEDVFVSRADAAWRSGIAAGSIRASAELKIAGNRNGNSLAVLSTTSDGGMIAAQVDASGAILPKAALWNPALGFWMQPLPRLNFSPAPPPLERRAVPRVTVEPRGENFEIVYLGQDGASLRFEYREYTTDDLARPAFSQSLSYPKSAGTFRFRTLQFVALDVSNDQLRILVSADQ